LLLKKTNSIFQPQIEELLVMEIREKVFLRTCYKKIVFSLTCVCKQGTDAMASLPAAAAAALLLASVAELQADS